MATEFNLPSSSFGEFTKILQGYSHFSQPASLEDISKVSGVGRTVVSANNKFLVDIGLITAGNKKSPTPLGGQLGRAIEHKQDDDARRYWREAVGTNEKVSGLVTTIRIKGGMSESDFVDHVLYFNVSLTINRFTK